jgi:hypothetical protein
MKNPENKGISQPIWSHTDPHRDRRGSKPIGGHTELIQELVVAVSLGLEELSQRISHVGSPAKLVLLPAPFAYALYETEGREPIESLAGAGSREIRKLGDLWRTGRALHLLQSAKDSDVSLPPEELVQRKAQGVLPGRNGSHGNNSLQKETIVVKRRLSLRLYLTK